MEVLGQDEADALCHSAFHLSAHLCRVDHHTRIGRLHAVEHTDLAGDPVHSDPESVGVAGHAAGRSVGFARRPQPGAASPGRGDNIG